MIAGYLDDRQRDALDRLRARAADVRTQICADDPVTSRICAHKQRPTRRTWEPVWKGPGEKKKVFEDGKGGTGEIRQALRRAGPEGLTIQELRARCSNAECVRMMRDVEVDRSRGYGRMRYRLAP